MIATEHYTYFPMVLFVMLYEEVLAFEHVDGSKSVTIQMKTTEQYMYFPRQCLLCCTRRF